MGRFSWNRPFAFLCRPFLLAVSSLQRHNYAEGAISVRLVDHDEESGMSDRYSCLLLRVVFVCGTLVVAGRGGSAADVLRRIDFSAPHSDAIELAAGETVE